MTRDLREQLRQALDDRIELILPRSTGRDTPTRLVHVFDNCPSVARAIRRDGYVERRVDAAAKFFDLPETGPCGWCTKVWQSGRHPNAKTLADRLLLKIEKTDSCWVWRGLVDRNGYGSINLRAGQKRLAHRLAYEVFVGAIPDGTELDHVCHTRDAECPGGDTCLHRRCVNPAHLEPVTHQINMERGRSPWAVSDRSTCTRGHLRTPENTWIRKTDGYRQCRVCSRERRAMRRSQQVEQAAVFWLGTPEQEGSAPNHD